MKFNTLLLILSCTYAWANLDLKLEEARYLWEMEGRPMDAIQKLAEIEDSIAPKEKWRPRLMRSEMLLRIGQITDARNLWDTQNLKQFPENKIPTLVQLFGNSIRIQWAEIQAQQLPPTYLVQKLRTTQHPIHYRVYLNEIARRAGAQWASYLDLQKSAIPTFWPLGDKVWWQHPEQRNIRTTDLYNGSSNIINSNKINLSGWRNLTYKQGTIWALQGQTLLSFDNQRESRKELKTQGLWVNWIQSQLVYVLKNGEIHWNDGYNLQAQNIVLGQDSISPIIHIQENQSSIHVIHASGTWTEVNFRKALVNRRQIPITEKLSHAWLDENGSVFGSNQEIRALDLNGNWLWKKSLESQIVKIQRQDQILLVSLSNQTLLGIDDKTGKELWRYESKNSYLMQPVITMGRIWLDQGFGWVRLDLKTGQIQERRRLPWRIISIQSSGKTLLVVSQEGVLLSYPISPK
jgi:outer membrane protein assembly factor BamB